MPASLRSPSSTSLGHFSRRAVGRRPPAPAHPGEQRQPRPAGRLGRRPQQHREGQRRPGRGHPGAVQPSPARPSGARRRRPAPPAHRRGPARRRRRWSDGASSSTSTLQGIPPGGRRARRSRSRGGRAGGWSVTGTSLPMNSSRRPHRRERTPRRGHRRPPGHRHPHHRGQAAGPRAPARRGGPRRLGQGGREAARQGPQDRPRADRAALRRGLLRRARRAGPAPVDGVRPGEEAPLRRRRGHRLRHHRRPPGVRVLPGLHGLRRLAGRGLRREDHQGDGPRHQDRLPDHRHQRGRRRPDPGGRGLARPLRRDLQAQRARLRRHPADLA